MSSFYSTFNRFIAVFFTYKPTLLHPFSSSVIIQLLQVFAYGYKNTIYEEFRNCLRENKDFTPGYINVFNFETFSLSRDWLFTMLDSHSLTGTRGLVSIPVSKTFDFLLM